MKKLIYSIIGLLMFAGCEDNYKTNITIPMSGIYLSSPAEGATMDLNDESKDSYEFTWDKVSEQGSVLIFSTTKDLVKQVTVEAGTGKNCSISALVINQLLSKLDIKSGNERLIYWTVKDKNNQTAAASEVRTLQARRMKSILLAPEDMSTATLLADATQTKIKFEWDASGIGNDTECTVLLSLDPEMDNFVELPTKGTGNISITHEEMEQTIEKLSIKRYRTNTIYWNVRNNADQSLISRVANTLYTNDMMRLVDDHLSRSPRDILRRNFASVDSPKSEYNQISGRHGNRSRILQICSRISRRRLDQSNRYLLQFRNPRPNYTRRLENTNRSRMELFIL